MVKTPETDGPHAPEQGRFSFANELGKDSEPGTFDAEALARHIGEHAHREPDAAGAERIAQINAMRGEDLRYEQTGLGGEVVPQREQPQPNSGQRSTRGRFELSGKNGRRNDQPLSRPQVQKGMTDEQYETNEAGLAEAREAVEAVHLRINEAER